MSDAAATAPPKQNAKTVQDYIDELPLWSDGTSLKSAPMTQMQWRIWGLAAAGKFFEGYVVFMTGVALPLIVREFHIAAGYDPGDPCRCGTHPAMRENEPRMDRGLESVRPVDGVSGGGDRRIVHALDSENVGLFWPGVIRIQPPDSA
jgi:hypothetical protein